MLRTKRNLVEAAGVEPIPVGCANYLSTLGFFAHPVESMESSPARLCRLVPLLSVGFRG
jgi:hypothetical protein